MARLIGNVDATGSLSTSVPGPATNASAVSLYLPFDSNVNDASANGYTVTANNGAAVSSAQAKFNSSLALDGTNDYLTVASGSEFQTFNSAPFTIEGFFYCTENSSSTFQVLVCTGSNNGGAASWNVAIRPSDKLFHLYDGTQYSATGVWTVNTWHHFAVCFDGQKLRNFIDGKKISESNYSNLTASYNDLEIGRRSDNQFYFSGYIDDLRITKSVALYSQNFVPPSQAVGSSLSGTNETNSTTGFTEVYLPLDTNTNDATGNYTITGTASVSSAVAKFGGGSALFNTGTTHLTAGGSQSAMAFTGAFTIEMWVYQTASPTGGGYTIAGAHNSSGWLLQLKPTTTRFYITGSNLAVFSETLTNNTWYHLAVVREESAGVVKFYLDGTLKATSGSTPATMPSNRDLFIGAYRSGSNSQNFQGYIDDFRILNFAKYTSNFTPPTSALTTTVSQARNDLAVLYLPFDDGLEDKARNHPVTANGNAAVSATQAKFVKSLYLDGNGDYLTIPHSGDFEFNDDVFTIEFWMRPSATNGDRIIYNKRANNGTYGSIYIAVKDGAIVAGATSNGSAWNLISVNTGFGSVSVNTWYHVAVVREADKTFKGYLDGVATTLSTNTAAIAANTTSVHIGGDTNTNYFSGYLDDLMISKFAKTFSAAPTAASGGEVIDVATDTRTFSSVWNVNSPEVTEAFKAGTWPKNVDTQYTSLWMDGSDLTDKSGTNTVTASGVVSSTAQGKFGGSSLFFDGSNDRLVLSNSSGSLELDGAFTVEFFARWDGNNNNVVDTVINFSDPSSNYCGLLVGIYGTNWTFWMSNAANNSWSINAQSFGTASANTWQHISITSDASGNIEAYLDGTRNATRSHSSRGFTSTDVYSISRIKNNNNWFGGYIDDLFVLKGYQLRTGASFTVPTTPFAGGV